MRSLNIRSNYGKVKSKLYNTFYHNKYDKINNYYSNSPLDNKDLVDILAIAFNNYEVIKYQYLLLKKNFLDDYIYTVADNSTDEGISKKIYDFCNKNKIPYCKLKKQNIKNMPSESHAMAMNFMYYNYLKPREAEYIAILDHDIFPIKTYSVKKILDKQLLYGKLQDFPKIKYLWPGFTFFKRSLIKNKRLNFMTYWVFNGDSGASNYKILYKDYFKKNKNLKFASAERINILGGDDVQNDMYSVIDGKWIHMINAGNWSDSKDFELKQKEVFKILNDILKN